MSFFGPTFQQIISVIVQNKLHSNALTRQTLKVNTNVLCTYFKLNGFENQRCDRIFEGNQCIPWQH